MFTTRVLHVIFGQLIVTRQVHIESHLDLAINRWGAILHLEFFFVKQIYSVKAHQSLIMILEAICTCSMSLFVTLCQGYLSHCDLGGGEHPVILPLVVKGDDV